ncbi:two-component system, CitB family, response regulator MalR [Melghirimyces thermohalophilus]|uniref:Transcriptional regulatory protein n=1 Tax=Melghirimyces thermohalophilus TaxID=1236220 RepID=A0A1G6IX50_9BACL|nr:response regulator [Melghirimyces thermohalophilus]SDC10983.1 two-component system, CitB family, response regulator MalR [Melghirimyces thermohalophilus]
MIQVLIVEDDPMVATINRRYVEAISGFRCVGWASERSEVFHLLAQNRVDLVLLDIFMPGQNGLELLRELRYTEEEIDVIVISAASDVQHIQTALRLGATDYLIKPFEFERLRQSLESYQKELELMRGQEEWSQEELDRLLQSRSLSDEPTPELPKGLTFTTLERVVESIQQTKAGFSTGDLAQVAGISRVSTSKYLKFLVKIGYLSVAMQYREVGRPVYRYYLTRDHRERIQPYVGTRS